MDKDLPTIPYNLYSQENFYELLVEKFPWAADYCYYYIFVIYAVRDSIAYVLKSVSDEDKITYTPEKAYTYLKNYERSRLRFITIIPTCNRPKAIKYLLEYSAVLYRRYAIDIVIYDSSDNDDTLEVVEEMQKNGYYNVVYKKYTGIFDGYSLDHKVMQAYEEFADEQDYIWICRDGLIPVVDEILEKLRYYKRKDIDCIIVDTKSRTNGLEIEKYYSSYEDAEDFLLDQSARLQTLGMLILSGKFAKKLLESEPLNEKTYSLWQMAAPFHAFARKPYTVVFCTKNVFAPNYSASTTHFWSKASKNLEQWAYRWNNVIRNMPPLYDKVKEKCMMVYTVDFHPFSTKTVFEMRGYGGLTYKMLRKYEKYLPSVTMTPLWVFRTAALLPVWVVRLILRIENRHHAFFWKLRRKIVPDKRD